MQFLAFSPKWEHLDLMTLVNKMQVTFWSTMIYPEVPLNVIPQDMQF